MPFTTVNLPDQSLNFDFWKQGNSVIDSSFNCSLKLISVFKKIGNGSGLEKYLFWSSQKILYLFCNNVFFKVCIWKKTKIAVGEKRCLLFSQRFQSLSHPCHFQTQRPKAESQGWNEVGVKLSFEINPTILIGGHLWHHSQRLLHSFSPHIPFLFLSVAPQKKNTLGSVHLPEMSSPLRDKCAY